MLIWCSIGPKSSLFGPAQFSFWASGAVNYDYIVINCLLIGSRMAHTLTQLAQPLLLITSTDI